MGDEGRGEKTGAGAGGGRRGRGKGRGRGGVEGHSGIMWSGNNSWEIIWVNLRSLLSSVRGGGERGGMGEGGEGKGKEWVRGERT